MSNILNSKTKGVETIEFHHPKGNSLPRYLLDELATAIEHAGINSKIKVIKLKSKGTTFCAGASFDELLAITNDNAANEFFSGFGRLIESIKNCPKFVIAQIQGKAVGGGVGLIAACDYAIATKQAGIKLSELSIGLGSFVIASVVIRKIGLSAFSTLAIHSENWQSAAWAYQTGLFNDLANNVDELEVKTSELCASLAGYSSEAMKKIKELLWEEYDDLPNIHKKRARVSGKLSQTELTQSILLGFKKISR